MNNLKSYFRPAGPQRPPAEQTQRPVDSLPQGFLGPPTREHGTRSPTLMGSPQGSRPTSSYQYPLGDVEPDALLQLKSEMMVEHVWKQQRQKMWSVGRPGEGVVLKKARGDYVSAPQSLAYRPNGLFEAVRAMNVRVAMTVSTNLMKIICSTEKDASIILARGLRVQVLPSIQALPQCQKHQFAAFVADEQMLVVWDDDPYHLIQRAADLEKQLLRLNWGPSQAEDEKEANDSIAEVSSEHDVDGGDLEAAGDEPRPTRFLSPIMVSCTLALMIAALGGGWRQLANEYRVDPKYGLPRLALIAITPLQMFLSLFFFSVVVTGVLQVIGPTSQVKTNSKCYSAQRPRRLRRGVDTLPHITIQCPVYKEGLTSVIQPTILSVKAAISTYEMQGGTANVFVNDDGMQLLPEAEARERRDFYDEHSIGWVARPKHNPNPNLETGEKIFLRRGKFKKASNMNYALMVSNAVEEKLLTVERDAAWNEERERGAYGQCLAEVLNELQGSAWADGNIRVGDYILLIDSDTRVPTDCLLDAASEMEQSPEVGIMQFSSGVMQVAHNFFENGITFFTTLIYSAIQYCCANGDVVPFVGHNAILRWSALQDVVYTDEDGYEKFWSESHVSEDFDMALRLQCLGYTIRYATYTGDGFKEGVSLTVYDELARWEKYAYGCNELLFHPLRFWFVRGPFTPLFRKFLTSNMRATSKITILSYIGTYYAIGAGWLLTLANYLIIGFMQGSANLSKYYLDSFKVWFSVIVVFTALGNVSLAVYRYRIGESSFLKAFVTNFKWVPLLCVFLGGLSLHVSQALLCHMFSIDMTWGATAKEVDRSTTFAKEWKKLFVKFKYNFLFCFLVSAMMIVFAVVVPPLWQIHEANAIIPLIVLVTGHFLLPVCLNPGLMMLRW
ncbi:MAG: hypothetical protein M1816_007723 [Peltula sp. TS41687]|nr:MAG: hypothetical protein M1816_007723 [Peltula sp. TS41687]